MRAVPPAPGDGISVCRTGPFRVNTPVVPLSDGAAFVLDVGGDAREIAAVLDRLSLVPAAVVCSHGHFDHVLGLAEFRSLYPDVPVAIHRADRGYLGKDGARRQSEDLHAFGLERGLSAIGSIPEADVLLDDGDTLSVVPALADNPVAAAWTVLHTPGHTPGSICLYNGSRGVLLSGDTLFYGGCGRTDLYGGDERAIRLSLSRLRRLPADTVVYPGHDSCAFRLGDCL